MSPRYSVEWRLLRMSRSSGTPLGVGSTCARARRRRWRGARLHDASRLVVGAAEAEKSILSQRELELAFAHDRHPDSLLVQPGDLRFAVRSNSMVDRRIEVACELDDAAGLVFLWCGDHDQPRPSRAGRLQHPRR